MSREKSSNQTAIPPKHALEHVYREPISFGEPTMFWVDEARLQEYLRLELEQLNKPGSSA